MTQARSVVVACHSGYGHTRKVADAVIGGVSDAGLQSVLLDVSSINDAGWQQLNDAAAIVFGSPTYMGSCSASFKAFADQSAKIWMTQGWQDKIAGGFTCSMQMSGDKFSTLSYFVTFAMQHGMVWVGVAGSPPPDEPGDPDSENRLGSNIGVMAQADNVPAEESPPQGDLDTAFRYGKRIARFASWNER